MIGDAGPFDSERGKHELAAAAEEAAARAPSTITRAEYERKLRHEYAGPGTPTDPAAPGVWWMRHSPKGTELVTGGTIVEVDRG
jgi:hypothetical protein